MTIFRLHSITNALQGQKHQHGATPCDWRIETFQALKGRKPIQRLLSPFQGFHPHELSLHRALPDANGKRLSAFTTVTSCLFFIHNFIVQKKGACFCSLFFI